MTAGLRAQKLTIMLFRALGVGIAIGIMETLGTLAQEPLIRVPFVTSIVLVMALPDSEPARPRSVIGGHLLSSLAGLLILAVNGPGSESSAIGVGLATFAMVALNCLHPPAGIDAFLIPSQKLAAPWIASPVLVGAVLLVIYARLWAAGERWLLRGLRLTAKIG
jgi:CBS-domain-containing membrane protein